MKSFYFCLLATVLIAGCAAPEQEASMAAKSAGASAPLPKDANALDGGPATEDSNDIKPASNNQSLMQDRMVIRTAQVGIRVENVEKAERLVNKIVQSHGGYVENTTSSDLSSDHPSMAITMRVPVGSFDEIMSGIEGLGVRLSKAITAQDVTEQVVDLQARMKTMLVEEQTFRNMLQGARDMNTIVSLQDKLTEIRSSIESLAAQRRSLSKQAAFSTITLTLEQSAVGVAPARDPNWLAQAWGESTTSMSGLIRSVSVAGIWLLVFCPIWVPLAFFAIKAARSAMPKPREVEI